MLGGVLNLSAGEAGGEWVLPLLQTCSLGRVRLRAGPTAPPNASQCIYLGTSFSILNTSFQLSFTAAPEYRVHPHFAEDQVKAQRGEVTWAK